MTVWAVELRREESRRRLQDLVRPAELTHFSLEIVDAPLLLTRDARADTSVDLRPVDPVAQGVFVDAELLTYPGQRTARGQRVSPQIHHHAHGTLTQLVRVLPWCSHWTILRWVQCLHQSRGGSHRHDRTATDDINGASSPIPSDLRGHLPRPGCSRSTAPARLIAATCFIDLGPVPGEAWSRCPVRCSHFGCPRLVVWLSFGLRGQGAALGAGSGSRGVDETIDVTTTTATQREQAVRALTSGRGADVTIPIGIRLVTTRRHHICAPVSAPPSSGAASPQGRLRRGRLCKLSHEVLRCRSATARYGDRT